MQRVWYPFRASTLVKLRELVTDVLDRLKLSLQVLQLDVSTGSQKTLVQVTTHVKDTAARTAAIQASVTEVRAQNQRLLNAAQSEKFRRISQWLAPPDPWINHASACQLREPHTGDWLLQSSQYRGWKAGAIDYLWVYGKAGCGKTVLSSTIVEDIKAHCENAANAGYAVFYFSFSDNQKQSYESLLRSIVVQLGWREPGLSMLSQAYEKSSRSVPGLDEQEKILLTSIESHNEVFLILDALDECPEDSEIRQNMLVRLERLLQSAPKLRILATSRDMRDIRESMKVSGAERLSISERSVDDDIRKYVSTKLSCDRRLSRIDPATKRLIEDTISQRSDGMFRWAYCQLQELKKLKSTKPKYVKEALRNLPNTLDATYVRVLVGIDEIYRTEAFTLLQWLAYAESPPSLAELAEAAIIDPSEGGSVDLDDRGCLEDTLDILSGLVTLVGVDDDEGFKDEESQNPDSKTADLDDSDSDIASSRPQIGKDTRVRLAHFSVKEYLESERILHSDARYFSLDGPRGHRFLAQSCLMYIMHYCSCSKRSSTEQDLVMFPLLSYAAKSWYYHSSLQQCNEVSRELSLLSSRQALSHWLLVHRPDQTWTVSFWPLKESEVGSSIYYAAFTGLGAVMDALWKVGIDINAQGGYYGSALQAASLLGAKEVVRLLLDRGADVSIQGGHYGSALQAASWSGAKEVVRLLLDRGADVSAQGGHYGNALQAASSSRSKKVVQLLLDRGADINAQGGRYSSSLHAASLSGSKGVVQLLLDRGADINAQEKHYGNALQAASFLGSQEVVKLLLERGGDVRAHGGHYGNALQAAACKGHEEVGKLLIQQGADVNAQGGAYNNALHAAAYEGHERVAKMLIE
ncbi:hypothetical protein K431DRAFT_216300, partial [Polychaeton citri CBS 116435]